MNLETVITRLYRHLDKRLEQLTITVTSGGVTVWKNITI